MTGYYYNFYNNSISSINQQTQLTIPQARVNNPQTRITVPSVQVANPSDDSCCQITPSLTYRQRCAFSCDFRLETLLYNNTGIFPYSASFRTPEYHSGSFNSFTTKSATKIHSVALSKGWKGIVQEDLPGRTTYQHLRLAIYMKGVGGAPTLLHAFAVPDDLAATTDDNSLTTIYQASSYQSAISIPAGLVHVVMEQYRSSNLLGVGSAYDAALIGANNPFAILELSAW